MVMAKCSKSKYGSIPEPSIENDQEAPTPSQVKTKWYVDVGDFFNTFKAFIGTNYLALPWAFLQSGIVAGAIALLMIASLTSHCCQLLVECKYIVIDKQIKYFKGKTRLSFIDEIKMRRHLESEIGYGELGGIVFGKSLTYVIDLAVAFTQFLTCVCYFIFLGNSIHTIWSSCVSESNLPDGIHSFNQTGLGIIGHEVPFIKSITLIFANNSELDIPDISASGNVGSVPDVRLLCLFPLVIFLFTALIRNIRLISPTSVIASIFLLAGAFMAVYGICYSIYTNGLSEFETVQWSHLPLFIGQMMSAYEGIGCVLPIESSMNGNRHLFPRFLYAAIFSVTIILGGIGVIGYLAYGSFTGQIIILNLSVSSLFIKVVNITLIVSVIFTHPLMCFPLIDILESYIFSIKCCSPTVIQVDDSESEKDLLVCDKLDFGTSSGYHSIDMQGTSRLFDTEGNSTSIPLFWSNVFRVVLTLVLCVIGVLLRNCYAYVTAFSGAIGCSLLAYIIPALLHFELTKSEGKYYSIVKDVTIIVFAIFASLGTLVTMLMTLFL